MRRSPWTTIVGIAVFVLALLVAWWLVGALFSVAWFIVRAVFAVIVALILAGIASYLVSRARSGD
jgi:multisubunit Na+/H+ antiporter MnhG subunit